MGRAVGGIVDGPSEERHGSWMVEEDRSVAAIGNIVRDRASVRE